MLSAEESIPSESPASLYARSVFFRQFNDVDIYVEDADQENLYFTIFSKLFPALKLGHVFPLGGKQNLLARASDGKDLARISVYVADKDFDDCFGLIVVRDNVFYLKRYCIENYLLEELALIEFVVSEFPRLSRDDIQRQLNFSSVLKTIIRNLKDLFALFFVVKKYTLEVKSTSFEPQFFCSEEDQGMLDNSKIERYAKDVSKALRRRAEEAKLHAEIDDCLELFNENDNGAPNISGEYILWLLLHVTRRSFNCSSQTTLDGFRYRLAQYAQFESLFWLRDRIAVYIKSARHE
jgi:hypothetical protein